MRFKVQHHILGNHYLVETEGGVLTPGKVYGVVDPEKPSPSPVPSAGYPAADILEELVPADGIAQVLSAANGDLLTALAHYATEGGWDTSVPESNVGGTPILGVLQAVPQGTTPVSFRGASDSHVTEWAGSYAEIGVCANGAVVGYVWSGETPNALPSIAKLVVWLEWDEVAGFVDRPEHFPNAQPYKGLKPIPPALVE